MVGLTHENILLGDVGLAHPLEEGIGAVEDRVPAAGVSSSSLQ